MIKADAEILQEVVLWKAFVMNPGTRRFGYLKDQCRACVGPLSTSKLVRHRKKLVNFADEGFVSQKVADRLGLSPVLSALTSAAHTGSRNLLELYSGFILRRKLSNDPEPAAQYKRVLLKLSRGLMGPASSVSIPQRTIARAIAHARTAGAEISSYRRRQHLPGIGRSPRAWSGRRPTAWACWQRDEALGHAKCSENSKANYDTRPVANHDGSRSASPISAARRSAHGKAACQSLRPARQPVSSQRYSACLRDRRMNCDTLLQGTQVAASLHADPKLDSHRCAIDESPIRNFS